MNPPTILLPTRFHVEPDHASRTVAVRGELDMSTAALLIHTARDTGDPTMDLTLDLSAVTFLDTAGAGALSTLHTELRADGRRLLLRGAAPRIARLLHMIQLDALLDG